MPRSIGLLWDCDIVLATENLPFVTAVVSLSVDLACVVNLQYVVLINQNH